MAEASPRSTTKRLLGLAAGLGALALGVYLAIPPKTVTHLDGSVSLPTAAEHVRTGLVTMLVSLPLFAAVLGALAALVPRPRGRSYRDRFARITLALLIAVYGVFAAMGAVTLGRLMLGS